MAFRSIWMRHLKYRIKNPATIMMTIIQPIIWLLLFSTIFNINPSPEFNNYTGFILPGIMMMIILYSCGMSGIANYTMKRNGTLKRMFMSPVKRRYILLGQMADVVLVTIAEIFLTFPAGLLLGAVFNSGFTGILTAVVLLLPVCGFIFCLSFNLSMKAEDENTFIAVINTVLLPVFFLSTALMPYENISPFFLPAVKLNPLSHGINALRSIMSWEKVRFSAVLPVFLLFSALFLLSFLFAVYSFNRKEL